MAVTASILGNLTVTDNLSGSVGLSKLINLAFAGNVEAYAQTLATNTTPSAISLPALPTQFLYIRNTDSVNSVIVTWTPNGGSSNIAQTLDPGSAIMFCQNGGSNGISALIVQASSGNPAIEFVLCG